MEENEKIDRERIEILEKKMLLIQEAIHQLSDVAKMLQAQISLHGMVLKNKTDKEQNNA